MKQQLKSKKGSALITVLIFMLVMSVLGTAAIGISMTETRLTKAQEYKIQARYLAQSGAQAVAEYMISNPDSSAADLLGKTSDIEYPMENGSFQVSVSSPDDSGIITILSTGTFNGISQNASINIKSVKDLGGGLFEHAIAAKDGITGETGQLHKIELLNNGSVATALSGISFAENIALLKNLNLPFADDVESDPSIAALLDVELNESDIPSDATYLSDSIYNGPHNKGRLINVSSDDEVHIRTGAITYTGNDSITVAGGGVVHLYVTGTLEIQTALITEDSSKLLIYVVGPYEVKFFGSLEGTGSVLVYAPESTVRFNNSNMDFKGIIYADVVSLGNGSKITYDPKVGEYLNNSFVHPPESGITFMDPQWSNGA